MLGLSARGSADARPLDRLTGIGRVDERDGDYADAQRKRRKVHLLASESTGALSDYFIKLMRSLAKTAKLPEANDTTIYGSARTSPRSFFEHYVSAISAAIVHTDSLAIVNESTRLGSALLVPNSGPRA